MSDSLKDVIEKLPKDSRAYLQYRELIEGAKEALPGAPDFECQACGEYWITIGGTNLRY